jgi:glycolate oxidase subunit GlcD
MPLTKTLTTQLADIVGPRYVVAEALARRLYEYDATFGRYSPDATVFPTSTEDVGAVVKACAAAGVPFTARGSGTSLSGGPVPICGGVIISLSRMDRIIELDYDNLRAVVQPGVINQDMLSILERRGYFFAPDPASQASCTLGGNVAENSGGPHCLKYGVTTNHILGLETVLPDGSVMRTGGKAVDWPGPDLTGVVVGSEGTFGIVTEITCGLMPLPEAVATMLAIFDSLSDATQCVSDIIATGIVPATLEMMDRPLMHAVQMAFDAGYPEDAAAVLIIEIDGLQAGQQAQIDTILDVCRRNRARDFRWAKDDAERALLWRGRKGAFGAVANISPNKLSTDVTVPRTELPQMLAEVMELGKKYDLVVGNVFHAGDGNLHPQVLYDSRNAEQMERVKKLDDEICTLALKHHGVLSGEHGIGHQKKKFMTRAFSPQDLNVLWRTKEAFDPRGLCNPGKILPDKTEIAPWEAPDLPPGSFAEVARQLTVAGEDGAWRPVDYEAAAQVLALAGREGEPTVIRGAGTKSGPASEAAQRVSSLGLDRVLDFDHENLTIVTQAGARLENLQALCATRGQFIPLMPPSADQATVGGVLACNSSGPHRWLYGTPRDLVIGLRFALSTGEIVHIGGACVKNVAGYALDKLLIGSRGCLGLIVEATIRTLPLPAARGTVLIAASDAAKVAQFAAELRASRLRPAACVATRDLGLGESIGVPLPTAAWTIAVAAHGTDEAVAYSQNALMAMAARHGLAARSVGEAGEERALWQRLTDAQEAWVGRGGQVVVAKAGVPVSQVALVAETAAALLQSARRRGLILADLGVGLVHTVVEVSDANRGWEAAADAVDRLGQKCREIGGHLTWSPMEVFRHLCSRQETPAETIAHRLKVALDPREVLPAL